MEPAVTLIEVVAVKIGRGFAGVWASQLRVLVDQSAEQSLSWAELKETLRNSQVNRDVEQVLVSCWPEITAVITPARSLHRVAVLPLSL
jgi:hypothetical protein